MPTTAELQKSIIAYYDNTWLDYRVFWLNKKNLSIHFGYYETFTETHSVALFKLNTVMAKQADIKPFHKVLDAGCGQGGSSFWLAENIGCETMGITLVPHQAEQAKNEAKVKNLSHKSQFFVQDYTATNFKNNSFDIIWACESLCHAENKKAFYDEAYRLLRPGGKIVVAEYIRSSRMLMPDDESILNTWCKGWSLPDLDTQEEHTKNMVRAGLSNIHFIDITKNVAPSLSRLYMISKILMPLGQLLNKLGIRNKIKHGNQTASVSQYEALTKNLWYYCICTATKPVDTL